MVKKIDSNLGMQKGRRRRFGISFSHVFTACHWGRRAFFLFLPCDIGGAIWSQGCDFPTKGAVQKSRILQNHVAFVEPPLKGWVKKTVRWPMSSCVVDSNPWMPAGSEMLRMRRKGCLSKKDEAERPSENARSFPLDFFGKGVVGSPKNHLFEKEKSSEPNQYFQVPCFFAGSNVECLWWWCLLSELI